MNAAPILVVLALAIPGATASADAVGELMDAYRSQGAGPFDPSAGRELWMRDFGGRSCTNCHGADVTQPGRHARTGKEIEPLAPSTAPDRLTDAAEIAKWLFRNCKWTMGRECTPQERGDVLSWLQQQ